MNAQTSPLHGTTLVLSYSQDEIILAADSRGVQLVGHYTFIFDNICKIGILGNRAMFAVAGFDGVCALGGTSCWDSGHDLARDLFKKLDRSDSNIAEELADEWAESMAEVMVRFYRIPSHWDRPADPSIPVTTAFFASVDEHGVMQAANAQIFRDDPIIEPTSIRVETTSKPRNDPPKGVWHLLTGGSGGNTAFEFAVGATSRAIEERKGWPVLVEMQVGSAAQMEENAVRLVDLSIQFFPVRKGKPSEVASPVDAARLTSSGVSWIQHKTNCN
jgi:hypothetical protein